MSAFGQALKSMRRAPYQAFAALLLVYVTFVVGYGLAFFFAGSHRVLEYFETRPQVTAFFNEETSDEVLLGHVETAKQYAGVREVRYINQEEALKIYQQQAGSDPVLLELVTADILPPSIEVSTVSLDALGPIAEEMASLEGIDEVVYQKDVVDSLRAWTDNLRKIGLGVTVVFGVTALLVITIITSIRVASRKGEIRIIRLMGATKWYILRPFLIEGMLYGILGSVLAWVSVYVGLLYSTPLISEFFGEVQLLPVPVWFLAAMLGAGTAVGILLGGVASVMSTRRLFRV